MNSRILNTIANAIDNKDEMKKRVESGKIILRELLSSVQNCQCRFGGKSELATEDDIRIVQLCEKWEKVLSHGMRTSLSTSAIQNIVAAGLNFTFNLNNIGHSLWSYTCLHLTKHEKERFKILSNINSPFGYFRAFLRASLNERSLERYLMSWLNHGLLLEYYEDGSLVRDSEATNLLPNMAAGLSSILFALSIDKDELNDCQQLNSIDKTEHVIPLPLPVKTSHGVKRKPLRQVISFDKSEQPTNSEETSTSLRKTSLPPEAADHTLCNSAPPTCLNSPDPKLTSFYNAVSSNSEPATSEYKSVRQFFPDTSKALDSPAQILTRLSECAKEIFSSSHSIDVSHSINKDDLSDLSTNNLRISESDSEEVAGSIDGSVSCLELCFTEDESVADDSTVRSIVAKKENDYLALQLQCSQKEVASKEKIKKLENVVLDLSRENDRLKEQLRKYMSAVEIGIAMKKGDSSSDEIVQYEKKLVQVAEMHAELMEFNQHLQRRLQEAESLSSLEVVDFPESNVKAYIPAAFLVGKKTHSYHVYQIFLKVGQDEWNVYHRYAKFRELHMQLKKCHTDIASYKFPPKKALGKKDAWLVEQRRVALQGYLRHILLMVPELRACTTRNQLINMLPFFGASSNNDNSGAAGRLTQMFTSRQRSSQDSLPSSYAAL